MKTKKTIEPPATGQQVATILKLLTEPQRKALAGKKFRMKMAMDCDDHGIIAYRCEELGLNKQIFTPRKNGHWEPHQVTYFFDNDERVFSCLADAVEALVSDGKLSV